MTDEHPDAHDELEQPEGWLRRHAVVLICVLNIAVGVLVAGLVLRSGPGEPPPRDFATVAASLEDCAGRDQTCYRDFLQAQTESADPRAAIEDIERVYGTDPFVQKECHELVHIVGHSAFEKYQTVKDAFAYGETLCEAGFYHGVVERAVIERGVETVVAQANEICRELTNGSEQSVEAYNCTHGLGHGFMAATNGDLYRALTSCDALERDPDRQSCYAGVFMENVNNDGGGGQPMSEFLKADDPVYPCTAVDPRYANACYGQQSPFIFHMTRNDPGRGFAICKSIADRRFFAKCVAGLGSVAYFSTAHDEHAASKYCGRAPGLVENDVCVQGIAVGVVTFRQRPDEANTFCDTFADPIRTDCRKAVSDAARAFQ